MNEKKDFFKRLIRLQANKLILQKEGLQIIDSIYDQQINLIGCEGEPTKLLRTLIHDSHDYLPSSRSSEIWISNGNYLADKLPGKKTLFLQTHCNIEEDKPWLHLLNSIISDILILNVHPHSNLSFLTSIDSRVLLNNEAQKISKKNIASIFVLIRQQKSQFSQNEEAFQKILHQNEITNQVKSTYEHLGAFIAPLDKQIGKNNNDILEMLQRTSLNLERKKNSEIMYGPVLKSFIQNIVSQLNQTGMIILEKAQNQIQVQEGYQGFTVAVSKYHQLSKNQLKNKPQKNIQEILEKNKLQAQRIYKLNSNNLLYSHRLNEYIIKKEQKIKEINNKLFDQLNVSILKAQSQNLFKKIKTNQDINPDLLKDEINGIVKKYERQAGGNQKEKLLNEYFSQMIPTLMTKTNNQSQSDMVKIQSKYLDAKNKNKQLQQKIKQLQSLNNSRKCCQIF